MKFQTCSRIVSIICILLLYYCVTIYSHPKIHPTWNSHHASSPILRINIFIFPLHTRIKHHHRSKVCSRKQESKKVRCSRMGDFVWLGNETVKNLATVDCEIERIEIESVTIRSRVCRIRCRSIFLHLFFFPLPSFCPAAIFVHSQLLGCTLHIQPNLSTLTIIRL